jgi:hypothetical protein
MKLLEYEESFGEDIYTAFGLFETEEQKQNILSQAKKAWLLDENMKFVREREIKLGELYYGY